MADLFQIQKSKTDRRKQIISSHQKPISNGSQLEQGLDFNELSSTKSQKNLTMNPTHS